MDVATYHRSIPLARLVALTGLIFLAILAIGLRPKDFSTSNQARWLSGRNGIRFEKYGVALTDPLSRAIRNIASGDQGFSIEIALKPEGFTTNGFSFIFLLYDGSDRSQLLIAQWQSFLIVMNGDDYDHRRKTKRISIKLSPDAQETQFVSIATGLEGTSIYLDGRFAAASKDLILELPGGKDARLILGNSSRGKNPWKGDIRGLALYGRRLSETDSGLHCERWRRTRSFASAKDGSPLLLYTFDEGGGKVIGNSMGTGYPLHIPAKSRILYPKFFSRSWDTARLANNLTLDAFLNFFGFIPFGMVLAATLVKMGGRLEKHSISISGGAGILVSATIEIIQAWMPSRSSDLQDLILNSAGMLAGAVIIGLLLHRRLYAGVGEKNSLFRRISSRF